MGFSYGLQVRRGIVSATLLSSIERPLEATEGKSRVVCMRVKSLLLTLALSFVMARSLAVSFTSDGITYVANADTAIIKGYSAIPESGELTLATTVNYEGKDYRVTTVQNSAFLSCTELKKLVVPSTIKYIQAGAFENCVNMSQLVLSEGEDMLDAASDAFKNCGIEEAEIGRNLKESIFRKSESLVSVKLTKNVTTIPSYAFSNCKKLSSINLENVRQIGEDAFCYCLMLKEINIANIEKIEREAFYGVGVEKVELPETLVELSFQSFAYCKSLKQVCIKGNLHEIPQYCFIGCSSLESIELSLSISKICYDAFRDCTSLNLISWGSVNIIQSDAFENTGFEEICLPKTLCELQFDSFLNCRNLKKIDLSKTQLETVNGFERCVSLEQVIFPDNLREIGKGCFSGCSALEDLHFPTNLEIVSDMAFSGMKKIKSIDFSCTKVHTIPYCCFYNCISLETVTLNALTDSICDSAFMNCSNLSYLSNTSNVQIVCKDAFKGTLLFTEDKIGPMMIGTAMYKYGGKIESKEYVVPSNVTCLCDGVFANQNFQTIKLNEGLKYVGSGAFDNCKKIVSLSIPGTVTHVKGSVGCSSLSLLSIQEGEEALSLEEFSGTLIKKVVLKRNLSASCDWMPNLESLTIGKNVTNLWGNSFESSLHLSNLEILDSSDKLSLGTLPVEGVKTLYLGRNIYDLLPRKNSDTFNSFKELSDFTIGEGVDSICDNFAANNTKLETLTLDKNISYVGHSAFSGAVNLKSLTISPNVKTVDESAFWGLEKLEKVVFFDGLENIGASAFAFNNKKTLPYIYVPKTIKNMGASSFLAIKCNKIVFPEGLQVIGHNAFSNVQTDSIVLPSSIKKMHESFTFSGIKFVDASKIKCNLNSSFYENRQLEKIILPNEGLTDLTENEFWYCSSLSNIDLPCTIKTIAHDAFSATMIEKLHIPSSVTTVGDGILRQTYVSHLLTPYCEA